MQNYITRVRLVLQTHTRQKKLVMSATHLSLTLDKTFDIIFGTANSYRHSRTICLAGKVGGDHRHSTICRWWGPTAHQTTHTDWLDTKWTERRVASIRVELCAGSTQHEQNWAAYRLDIRETYTEPIVQKRLNANRLYTIAMVPRL